ncbi:hypothetical protein ACW9H6_12085 [Pseudomonas sp. SDO528_S397]
MSGSAGVQSQEAVSVCRMNNPPDGFIPDFFQTWKNSPTLDSTPLAKALEPRETIRRTPGNGALFHDFAQWDPPKTMDKIVFFARPSSR